jgi:hypothetical protein
MVVSGSGTGRNHRGAAEARRTQSLERFARVEPRFAADQEHASDLRGAGVVAAETVQLRWRALRTQIRLGRRRRRIAGNRVGRDRVVAEDDYSAPLHQQRQLKGVALLLIRSLAQLQWPAIPGPVVSTTRSEWPVSSTTRE